MNLQNTLIKIMISPTIENLNSRNNQINTHSCWWHYYEKKESSKSHRIVHLWKKVIFYCFYHKSICLSSKRHCTGNCSLFFNGNTITKRGSASTIWSFFSYGFGKFQNKLQSLHTKPYSAFILHTNLTFDHILQF